jgi:DNA repair exonuclease SbcCD ATPase subunit
MEALVSGILMRGLSPTLLSVLMAAPSRKTVRAQLKKIYVLDDHGEMAGEYILDADCPIDYDDFLKVLPPEGIGDRDSLFVGEYVFTAFQSGKFVFVLLSRGHLTSEDVDWTALLLTAADSHLAAAKGAAPVRPPETKPDLDKAVAERESRLVAREKAFAEQEAKLKAESANLLGRQEELGRQKANLTALADYAARMQDSVTRGVSRAAKTLEMTEQIAASQKLESKKVDSKTGDARQAFEQERKALLTEKGELESRYREASSQIEKFQKDSREAVAALEKERGEAAARSAEEEKTRKEIEARVADLSQRFAAMAKERIAASHREPAPGETDEVRKAMEGEKGELVRERKFLQRRAIELLDREERVRDREAKSDDREHELARRMDDLTTREQDVSRQKALLTQAKTPVPDVRAQTDDAKKDIERRVKIIQQKALELLDREEKLRRRAAELEAMEARLSGRVTAE